ncbi:tryptophan synthase beta subunit-like PLP-dependent enzyme [Plenodomus tracheiphilus IPT5]|uniref:Tryptophan synthase beta subunit-like PLP-dependent enzyme n=1 Tax=Plenodomus tracheiphilus IPT5 TaxID=1408161 RepID=A0A6A7BE61_9PLEO|nr:tryptophan synthase beta subunit-like PLP-dependent enzyme [Plenodomus tracheiphilus IPT5]
MYHNPSASTWAHTNPAAPTLIQDFHRTLPNYAITPLTPLPSLAKSLGISHVLLKDESSRLGLPAFKILGASWAIHKALALKFNLPLTVSLEKLGVAARENSVKLVTCTEGNWGRAVARMAKYLQIEAVIFVPNFMDETTQRKIEGEGEGTKVVVVDGGYDFSIAKARGEADKGGMLVMDVSWEGYEEIPEWVVEGYNTMLVEADKQLQDMSVGPVTHAIVSVGVGSWAQAVTMHYKAQSTPVTVVTVEPEDAASLKASLEAGKITPITTGHTIMNGMNCGTTSTTAWKVLKKGVDLSVTVSDVAVHHDLQYLDSQGVRVGPCGAAPLTALKQLSEEQSEVAKLDEKSVVILFSTEGARDYVVPSGA